MNSGNYIAKMDTFFAMLERIQALQKKPGKILVELKDLLDPSIVEKVLLAIYDDIADIEFEVTENNSRSAKIIKMSDSLPFSRKTLEGSLRQTRTDLGMELYKAGRPKRLSIP